MCSSCFIDPRLSSAICIFTTLSLRPWSYFEACIFTMQFITEYFILPYTLIICMRLLFPVMYQIFQKLGNIVAFRARFELPDVNVKNVCVNPILHCKWNVNSNMMLYHLQWMLIVSEQIGNESKYRRNSLSLYWTDINWSSSWIWPGLQIQIFIILQLHFVHDIFGLISMKWFQ